MCHVSVAARLYLGKDKGKMLCYICFSYGGFLNRTSPSNHSVHDMDVVEMVSRVC